MQFDAIKQESDTYLMRTYKRFPVALVQGKNATAWDADGKKYIDLTAGIGVNSLGYSDPAWATAVANQAAQLQHISNLYYSPVTAKAARLLCQASGMRRVFFCNSGAEANECGIKLARKYGTDHYGPAHCHIVTLQNSFHGRTVATLEATGQDVFHEKFGPFTGGFSYAAPDLGRVQAAAGPDTCAVMLELIQGEGGVLPLDKDFVQALARWCRQQDILLLVDEVQTGVGRTGSFYAYQQYGVLPDIVSSAKGLAGGLPIGACLAGDKCADVLAAGDHGSTFGGNPVSCAAAVAVLERVDKPDFLQAVREKAAYLRGQLQAMPGIAQVRGLGLMLGAAPERGTAGEIAAACASAGLLLLTAKDALRFLPPLTITQQELDEGLAILRQVLARQ